MNAIGLLPGNLPGRIPDFYTRMTFVMELMVSIGDGTYSGLDSDSVTGIYRDLGGMIDRALALGREIIAEIDTAYEIETKDEDASR